MRRRTFVATLGTGLAAGTAGCLGDDDSGDSLPAATTTNQENSGETVEGTPLEVQGHGSVGSDPNEATIRVAVEESAQDAGTVSDGLAERSEALRSALLDAGIDEDDIETARYDIGEQHRGTGYEGVHSFAVEIADVDSVGDYIDTAIEAGADDVDRVQFGLDDETRADLREQALEAAIEDAREEADVVASAQGMEIVGIAEIVVDDRGFSPVRVEFAAAGDADSEGASPPTQVHDGTVEVTASVTVTYALQ